MASKMVKPNAEFLAEASGVMNAPYWSTPGGEDAREQVAAANKLIAERATLSTALRSCTSYKDLQKAAKSIYDRAKKTLD